MGADVGERESLAASAALDGPLVGITCDLTAEGRPQVRSEYARAVLAAGGTPVLLAPEPILAPVYAARLDAFVLTGGDDPIMEAFGEATDARVTPVHPMRQAFEVALLEEIRRRRRAALGVCLGMQYMALCAGGRLNQWLADDTPSHAAHWENRRHAIEASVDADALIVSGEIVSHHRQAVAEAGSLRIAARADDGVIEAVTDPDRAFFIGVQWHPERSGDGALGQGLFRRLVEAARDTRERRGAG